MQRVVSHLYYIAKLCLKSKYQDNSVSDSARKIDQSLFQVDLKWVSRYNSTRPRAFPTAK